MGEEREWFPWLESSLEKRLCPAVAQNLTALAPVGLESGVAQSLDSRLLPTFCRGQQMQKVDLVFGGLGLRNAAPDKRYGDKRPTHRRRIRWCEDPRLLLPCCGE